MEIQIYLYLAGLVHWSGIYYVTRSNHYIIETSRTVCLPQSSPFRKRITKVHIVKFVTYRNTTSQTHDQCA